MRMLKKLLRNGEGKGMVNAHCGVTVRERIRNILSGLDLNPLVQNRLSLDHLNMIHMFRKWLKLMRYTKV